ncbi:MAG TPA: hypothetical protein VJG32_01745 [Anaerolineae bacterium]|nr:hypothetical protein [Anaerolineae bacterium]
MNQKSLFQIRNLETRLGHPLRIRKLFEADLDKPMRAVYLGVIEGYELIGCARVVPEPDRAVLLDALEVQPDHPAASTVVTLLIHAVRELAATSRKPLAVIADADSSQQWTQLGFQPNGYTLLTLA